MLLTLLFLQSLLHSTPAVSAGASEADNLIRRSEFHTRGESLEAEVTMKVVNAGDERTLGFKLWTEGRDKATVKIQRPAKDRDSGNLRLGLKLWQFLPNVDRVVTIPPSMMLQSWMGSDFTNDDLVRTSSLTEDYTHQLAGREKVGKFDTIKIICTPKPTAPVVWGKIIEWVRSPDAVPIKREFYSEQGELLKVLQGDEIRTYGKHTVPTLLTMTNMKKKDSHTTVRYEKMRYDGKIDESVFRQEFLRMATRE